MLKCRFEEALTVIEPENIVLNEKVALWRRYQVKHLAESELVFFFRQLEATADEDEDGAGDGGRLGVDGADDVSTTFKWQLLKL